MSENLIRFMFMWGPTILFIVGILTGFIVGMLRGFRKSFILALQAGIAFAICLILYLVLVNQDGIDQALLNTANTVLQSCGGKTLQEILNVSADCEGIKDILVEYIPKSMNYGTGLELVLAENGAYLATLVNIVYHILFAFLLYIVYFVFIFILYLIYLIFYPERRFKNKKRKAYRTEASEKPYRKHPFFGGLVGGCRGLIVGLVGISFLGSLFFVLGGGIGDKSYDSYEDIQFEQNNSLNISEINSYYEIYKCLGSYGTTGIFKVLNTLKDTNQVPYYLYAADLVLQGGLKDETRGIDENIYLRKEIGAYTKFSADTLNLIMKYGSKEIADYINHKSDTSDEEITDILLRIMLQEDFQTEFNLLIDEFDAQTYFINFSLSLLDSLVSHIDDDIAFFNDLDNNTKQVLKIMFSGEEGIKVSSLLTKNDAKELLKTTVAVLNISTEGTESSASGNADVKKALSYGEILVPEILELSILNDAERSKPLNQVLRNLYDYFAIQLEDTLAEESRQTTYSPSERAIKLANVSVDDIDWIAELKNLLSTGLSALELYDSLYTAEETMTDSLFAFFAADNPSQKENEDLYDSVTDGLGSSKLLGVVLSMSFMSSMVNDMVLELIPNAVLPSSFDYINEMGENGEIVKYGEVYHLLTAIKLLAKNPDAKVLLDSFSGDTTDTAAIRQISELLTSTAEDGRILLDEILVSQIFEYAVSGLILNLSLDTEINLSVYVPSDCREMGKEDIPLIIKSELKNAILALPALLDILEKSENSNLEAIVEDEALISVLQSSRIIEGTISNRVLYQLTTQENIIIPKRLSDTEAWLSTPDTDGEIIQLIRAIQSADIHIIGGDINNIVISKDKVKRLLQSDILYYTMSQSVVDMIDSQLMPLDAYDKELSEAEERNIILKPELIHLTEALEVLFDSEETGITIGNLSFDTLTITLEKFARIKESFIAYKKITDELETALSNDIPNTAYQDSTDKYYILENEFASLIVLAGTDGVIQIGGDMATDFSFEKIEKSKFTAMSSSVIIRYQVSKTLLGNETIVIPAKVLEQDIDSARSYIREEEFLSFLNAFSAAYGNAEGDIMLAADTEVSLPRDETKHKLLTDSVILRATITKHLTISANGSDMEIYAELADIDTDYEDALVLKQAELCRIMAAIVELSNEDSTDFIADLDLNRIASEATPESIYKIASSNVIRLVLNQLIAGATALFHYETIYNIKEESAITIKDYDEITGIYSNRAYALEYREILMDISGTVVAVTKYAIPSAKIEQRSMELYSFAEGRVVEVMTYTEQIEETVLSSSRETLQAYFTMLKAIIEQAQGNS